MHGLCAADNICVKGRPYVCKNSWNDLIQVQHLFWLRARMFVHPKFITSENTISDSRAQPGRNLSGCFDIRVLLRNDALADCCIAFLSVDEVDDVPKLSFLVSRGQIKSARESCGVKI